MTRTFCVAGVVLALAGAAPAKIVDRIVAQVNDDIITLSDLNREVALMRQELAAQYSGEQLEAAVKKAEKAALEWAESLTHVEDSTRRPAPQSEQRRRRIGGSSATSPSTEPKFDDGFS